MALYVKVLWRDTVLLLLISKWPCCLPPNLPALPFLCLDCVLTSLEILVEAVLMEISESCPKMQPFLHGCSGIRLTRSRDFQGSRSMEAQGIRCTAQCFHSLRRMEVQKDSANWSEMEPDPLIILQGGWVWREMYKILLSSLLLCHILPFLSSDFSQLST